MWQIVLQLLQWRDSKIDDNKNILLKQFCCLDASGV
jgi:hypothetical protein